MVVCMVVCMAFVLSDSIHIIHTLFLVPHYIMPAAYSCSSWLQRFSAMAVWICHLYCGALSIECDCMHESSLEPKQARLPVKPLMPQSVANVLQHTIPNPAMHVKHLQGHV